MSQTSVTLFTLFYSAVSVCFVLRTSEFVSAGITVEYLFDWYLKSEHEHFILHHIKRSTLTFLIHSFLPLIYVVGVTTLSETEQSQNGQQHGVSELFWCALQIFSVLLPVCSTLAACYWRKNDWANHPVIKTLKIVGGNRSWREVAADINIEYRRVDKIVLHTSSVITVIATDNWLMKVTPYHLKIIHQTDSVLILSSADEHHLSRDGDGLVQYVNIEVKSLRPRVKSFMIRCNALDFRDLQDRLQRPVSILEGIKFHKTKIERFVDAFKEAISQNPLHIVKNEHEVETCMGCMLTKSDVKLVKNCNDDCMNCYCRPLWCVDCMAKWFASRQEQDRPETWLGSKCTCPVCRSLFCILDVCPVQIQDVTRSSDSNNSSSSRYS